MMVQSEGSRGGKGGGLEGILAFWDLPSRIFTTWVPRLKNCPLPFFCRKSGENGGPGCLMKVQSHEHRDQAARHNGTKRLPQLCTNALLVAMSMQMESEFKEEQIGAIYIPRGEQYLGAGGGVLFGHPPRLRSWCPQLFYPPGVHNRISSNSVIYLITGLQQVRLA